MARERRREPVFRSLIVATALVGGLAGCATEAHRTLEPSQVAAAGTPYQGPKSTLVVGKFDNRSSYLRGLFSDGVDRLGGQAKGVLITHLQQTGRFTVVERDNLEEITREAAIKGAQQQLKGADFAVTGDVAEFGRKEVGDVQLFGILGSGKKQVAYSKVNLNVDQRAHLGGRLLGPGRRGVRAQQPRGAGVRRHRGVRLHPERQGSGSRHPRGGQPPGRGSRTGEVDTQPELT